MAHSPFHIINQATFLIDREGGFVPFIRNAGFGGISLAVFAEVIGGISGFGSVIFGIPRAIGLGMILLIEVFFRSSGAILGAGAEAAIRSFSDGLAGALGPLAQPLAVGTIMLSLGVLFWSLNRISVSPFSALQSVR